MTQMMQNVPNPQKAAVHPYHAFHPRQMIPSLTAGVASGIIEVVAAISLAALVYSSLPGFEAQGIGLTLFGTMIIGVVVALTSSYAGMVAGSQDIPAAILSLIAISLSRSLTAPTSPTELFVTVVTAVFVSSLLTGLFFLLLGYLKLGGLIRFLPYPVVGGFLAGTGWLLAIGGVGVMTGASTDLSQIPAFFQPDILARWLPGLLFALLIMALLNRSSHFLIVPAAIAGAIGLFYGALALTQTPLAEVSNQGWLMGPFPTGRLWQPLSIAELSLVNWPALLGQSGNITAILMVSVVGLLLNVTGLELIFERDVDLNRELRAAGWGTLGASLSGGIVGYQSLGQSALAHKMGVNSRLVGFLTALICGLTLWLGGSMLALMPRLVLGGLLLFLGMDLLREWVYRAWFNFSRIDYLIILTILVVIVGVGFLEGITLGIGLAVVLFAINYSRINVVKRTASGAQQQSRVRRPETHRQILEQRGDEIYIFQLQGFIFFGTANNLLNEVRCRLAASPLTRPRFLLFDFRHVTGLDSTAHLSFARLSQLARSQQLTLVFTTPAHDATLPGQRNLTARLLAHLERDGQGGVQLYPDLDRALEWCENQILLSFADSLVDEPVLLQTRLQQLYPDILCLPNLLTYFERLEVDPGHYLTRTGDVSDALYFIESGQVTLQLEDADREPLRLETMRGGQVVGEIGFFLNQPRTKTVVTDEACTLYRLTMSRLRDMDECEPDLAAAFHRCMVQLLAERVNHLITTIDSLKH